MGLLAEPGLIVLLGQVFAVGLFAWLAFHKGWLTVSAAATAFLMGAVIVLATNVFWLLALVSLLAFTALATRFKYSDKVARGTAEGKSGARRVRNVLANGLAPTIVAALAPLLPALGGRLDWTHIAGLTFLSAIAAASADTMASELGGLSDKVYLITTLRRVPPGTDGGVSLAGQLASLLGGALIALAGIVLLGVLSPALGGPGIVLGPSAALIPIVAGFAGCQVDSLLGATLELRGLINKEEVNILGITSGALLGFALGVAFW